MKRSYSDILQYGLQCIKLRCFGCFLGPSQLPINKRTFCCCFSFRPCFYRIWGISRRIGYFSRQVILTYTNCQRRGLLRCFGNLVLVMFCRICVGLVDFRLDLKFHFTYYKHTNYTKAKVPKA